MQRRKEFIIKTFFSAPSRLCGKKVTFETTSFNNSNRLILNRDLQTKMNSEIQAYNDRQIEADKEICDLLAAKN
jgi:hypothetical protein